MKSSSGSLDLPFAATAHPKAASIRHLPVNLFGSVMGLSGLALAWQQAGALYGAPAAIGEALGLFAMAVFVVLGLAYLAKWTWHREAVSAEFAHPVAGNFFGAVVISLLLVSALVSRYSPGWAEWVWSLGAALTFALSFVVVSRLMRGSMDAKNVLPALLIPGVAALDVVVTGAAMPMRWATEVNWAALGVGGAFAPVLFTLVFSRLMKQEAVARPMVPSLMVLMAPLAVGFLAYTQVTGSVDRFASSLFYAALFLFIVLVPKVFRRDVPFGPGWWAISFPIAALSNAALKYAQVHPSPLMETVAWALLLFLSGALAVLTVKTARIVANGALLRG